MSMQRRAIAATRRGARRAGELHVHQFVLREVIGQDMEPDTAVVVDRFREVDTGWCKVQGFNAQGTEPEAGGHSYLSGKFQVHFRRGASAAKKYRSDMLLEVVGSKIPEDAGLVGQLFRLTEPDLKSLRTADRWNVEVTLS